MKSRVNAEFIQKFREKHNLNPDAYVKPTMQSEQLFIVGYAIKPFRMCANEYRTHGGGICFS